MRSFATLVFVLALAATARAQPEASGRLGDPSLVLPTRPSPPPPVIEPVEANVVRRGWRFVELDAEIPFVSREVTLEVHRDGRWQPGPGGARSRRSRVEVPPGWPERLERVRVRPGGGLDLYQHAPLGARWQARLGLGLYVPLPSGAAGVGELLVAFRAEGVVVRLDAGPLALGGYADDFRSAGLVTLSAGFEVGPFELTLGGGWSTFRERSRGQSLHGPVAAATVRAGWPEGVQLEARFALLFADLLADVATIDGRLQLPVETWARLIGVGGFGMAGLWRALIGAQLFAQGTGGPGSIALSLLGGVAGMFDRAVCSRGRCTYDYLVSPAITVEIEWRP